ncbi:MAG: isopropylmalate/homocitrate/citramalate synthase, partial [Planctomycetota bacterium]
MPASPVEFSKSSAMTDKDPAASEEALIYDWNAPLPKATEIQFDDETLRDGIQSPSALDPELDEKLELIHLMEDLGIQTADIGLPGASQRAREHILTLAKEMTGMKITPNVACRTLISDIAPVVDIVQATGDPVEVCAFIGSSPIRQYTEDWTLEQMVKLSRDAIEFATKEGLPSMFVTEDTTRAHPDTVRALYTAAIEAGAKRLCVCDTCGHSTPEGVRRLVAYVKGIADELGA